MNDRRASIEMPRPSVIVINIVVIADLYAAYSLRAPPIPSKGLQHALLIAAATAAAKEARFRTKTAGHTLKIN